jgi:hypothetical protein
VENNSRAAAKKDDAEKDFQGKVDLPVELPASIADLATGLANVNRDALALK